MGGAVRWLVGIAVATAILSGCGSQESSQNSSSSREGTEAGTALEPNGQADPRLSTKRFVGEANATCRAIAEAQHGSTVHGPAQLRQAFATQQIVRALLHLPAPPHLQRRRDLLIADLEQLARLQAVAAGGKKDQAAGDARRRMSTFSRIAATEAARIGLVNCAVAIHNP